MTSPPPLTVPPVSRMIYRSLLRACANGRRPECLPPQGLSRPLPSQPSEVVARLRSHFEQSDGHIAIDPFAALRHTQSAAYALWPDVSAAEERPACVLRKHILLPHEGTSFVFFEPRYRRLAELVLPKDGRFVHLPELRDSSVGAPMGTLCTITDHQHLDDGRLVAVNCVAGPRVMVNSHRYEAITDTDTSETPPLLHVTCEYAEDYKPDDTHVVAATGRECVHLLDQLSSLVGLDLLATATTLPPMPPLPAITGSAPPLFSTERLSFFLAVVLARYNLLADHDRLEMLYGLCTSTRLERTADLLQETLEKLLADSKRPEKVYRDIC